jgi:hypothetical protein
VPRPDADALPPDRTMQNLVALVRSRVRAGPVLCANECGRAVEVDCQICAVSMCNKCFDDMHKFPLMKSHPRLALGAVREEKQEKCRAHKENLNLFCATCEELVFIVCERSSKHKGHSIMAVEDATAAIAADTLTEAKQLAASLPEMAELSAALQQRAKATDAQCASAEAKVTQQFQELIGELQRMQESALRAVRSVRTSAAVRAQAAAALLASARAASERGLSARAAEASVGQLVRLKAELGALRRDLAAVPRRVGQRAVEFALDKAAALAALRPELSGASEQGEQVACASRPLCRVSRALACEQASVVQRCVGACAAPPGPAAALALATADCASVSLQWSAPEDDGGAGIKVRAARAALLLTRSAERACVRACVRGAGLRGGDAARGREQGGRGGLPARAPRWARAACRHGAAHVRAWRRRSAGAAPACRVAGLTAGTGYRFRVSAVNELGRGAPSRELVAHTQRMPRGGWGEGRWAGAEGRR